MQNFAHGTDFPGFYDGEMDVFSLILSDDDGKYLIVLCPKSSFQESLTEENSIWTFDGRLLELL